MGLTGKRVLLGITGGIAAYKAAELTRLLVKAGADVRVAMTRGRHPVRRHGDDAGAFRPAGMDRPVGRPRQ